MEPTSFSALLRSRTSTGGSMDFRSLFAGLKTLDSEWSLMGTSTSDVVSWARARGMHCACNPSA